MENFENNNTVSTTESAISKIEEGNFYSSANIERTSDFCKDKFNTPWNIVDICASLEENLKIWLKDEWIDFKKIFKTKTA
jgi:hypothetical protein